MRFILTVFSIVVLCPPALAQPDQVAAFNQAMNNLSHEYVQCAAYFAVVSVAMENSGKPDTAAQYMKVSDSALENAAIFGDVAGLLPEATAARYEMELQTMADRIANNTSNISILGRDYAKPCLVAMEDMDSRVDFWLNDQGVQR